MATIRFKGKIKTVYNMDGTPAYDCIRVPEFTTRHCDMNAFRSHPKFGALANSDLFLGVLRRLRHETFKGDYLRMDRVPPCVEVETSGFLATVTVHV